MVSRSDREMRSALGGLSVGSAVGTVTKRAPKNRDSPRHGTRSLVFPLPRLFPRSLSVSIPTFAFARWHAPVLFVCFSIVYVSHRNGPCVHR